MARPLILGLGGVIVDATHLLKLMKARSCFLLWVAWGKVLAEFALELNLCVDGAYAFAYLAMHLPLL